MTMHVSLWEQIYEYCGFEIDRSKLVNMDITIALRGLSIKELL